MGRSPDAVMAYWSAPTVALLGSCMWSPAECSPQPGEVGRLVKSMYGCRNAGVNWEREVARVMDKNGFRHGPGSPCVYWHPRRRVRCLVHGDDFVSEGRLEYIQWMHDVLGKELPVVVRGYLGAPSLP